jgi:hypothetical protein
MIGSVITNFTRGSALAAVLLVVGAAPAMATPVQFGSNYYEFVLVLQPGFADGSANTWTAASASAAASTFGGATGHLATITSAAENAFLTTLVPGGLTGFQGAWLGGNASGWLVGPDSGTLFATPGTYTNWGGVEPNNGGFMYMNIGNAGPGGLGFWIDDSGVQGLPEYPQDPVIGYFVEYENPQFNAPVPEPASLGLMGVGLLALAFRLKRRASVKSS